MSLMLRRVARTPFLLFTLAAALHVNAFDVPKAMRGERRQVTARAIVTVRNLRQLVANVPTADAFLRDDGLMRVPFCHRCSSRANMLDQTLWTFLERATTRPERLEEISEGGRDRAGAGPWRSDWRTDRSDLDPLPIPENQPRTSASFGPPQSLVASQPPDVMFQGLSQNEPEIPPDTMGAVSPSYVMTVHNQRIRILDRAGNRISTYSTHDFWSFLENTPSTPYTFDLFDPKIYFDRVSGRFIFCMLANAVSADSAILIAISDTDDPNGGWVAWSLDADATGTFWADYPSVGYNSRWVALQVNMGSVSGAGGGHPELYVMDKSTLLAGTTLLFTKFTGTSATTPFEFDAGSYAPAIDADNASPDTMWLLQAYSSTAGQLRVSKVIGSVGSESLVIGTQFPQSTESWDNHDFVDGQLATGWAPQANAAKTATSPSHVMTNPGRIWNAVLRGGTLWGVHSVQEPTAHQNAGVAANSAAHPANHSAVQWWHIDPSIANTQSGQPPLALGRIEDPSATDCFDGTSAQISGCTEQGTFYAMPTISVNDLGDVLIGFTRFNAVEWPSTAYAYHDHGDGAAVFRDVAIYRTGSATYLKTELDGRRNRWGDYSATMIDPSDDRNFWTVQEYAESATDGGGPGWATSWARVAAMTAATASAPAITCPLSFSVNTDPGSCGAVVNFTGVRAATASGLPVPTISYSPVSGSVFPTGTSPVTVTAVNANGSTSCTFYVTVIDNVPPTVTCPADISVIAAAGATTAIVTYSFGGQDNCGVTTAASIPSGSAFAIGVTRVTVTATDTASHSASCSFNVTVRPATTAFTDDPLIPGATTIKAVHLAEIRQEVNRVRIAAGLQAVSWSTADTIVRASHVTEIRNALAPVLSAQGRTANYAHPTLTAGMPVTAVDFEELRNLTR
jgi:hypothetical protein